MIGKRVKEARTRCDPPLTQAALASRLQLAGWDISRVGVAKIETGIREVTNIELMKLAKALHVTRGGCWGKWIEFYQVIRGT